MGSGSEILTKNEEVLDFLGSLFPFGANPSQVLLGGVLQGKRLSSLFRASSNLIFAA